LRPSRTPVRSRPDACAAERRDSECMKALVKSVAWQRWGAQSDFVGTLRADDHGIRLTGRDRHSGVDVALSIPFGEVADVRTCLDHRSHVAVVLELEDGKPILLRPLGVGALGAEALAHKLVVLVRGPRLLIPGG
jgi:hypothetical protein